MDTHRQFSINISTELHSISINTNYLQSIEHMSFWKITTANKPERVSTTKLKNEQILEKHLEDWIEDSTDILVSKLNRKFKTN